MKQAERIVKQGGQTLTGLASTYRKCWEAACRHDGFDPDTVIASFSPSNPYTLYLHRLFKGLKNY